MIRPILATVTLAAALTACGSGIQEVEIQPAPSALRVVADSTNDVRAVEQPSLLSRREAVAHVRVNEDFFERPPPLVLTDDVGGDALLLRRAREQEGERIAENTRQLEHAGRILAKCAGARQLAGSPSVS